MSYTKRGINRMFCDYTSSFVHGTAKLLQQQEKLNSIAETKASGPLYEIYLRNMALMPNYCGHVPGAKFRYGRTFGNDTVDAKRVFKPL